jgi:hypothetical protein
VDFFPWCKLLAIGHTWAELLNSVRVLATIAVLTFAFRKRVTQACSEKNWARLNRLLVVRKFASRAALAKATPIELAKFCTIEM